MFENITYDVKKQILALQNNFYQIKELSTVSFLANKYK